MLDDEPPLELEFWAEPLLPLLPPLLLLPPPPDPLLLDMSSPLLGAPPLLPEFKSEYAGGEGLALQPDTHATARMPPSLIERRIVIVLSAQENHSVNLGHSVKPNPWLLS